MISEKDGMTLVYVPEGNFTMGSDNGAAAEKPAHTIYLDAFWIDRTEVTNKQYAACVADRGCITPFIVVSSTRASYYSNPEFDNYPVIYVDWNMANAYCSWAGRRLPAEAEWEKSVRDTDARIYPWGNGAPNKDLLNYDQNIGDTTKAGNYETGKSFYGAYDMAGNVWEWVNDWYGDTYYQSSPPSNPLGPDSGRYRVLRGGSWSSNSDYVRPSYRYRLDPSYTGNAIGFRCARSVENTPTPETSHSTPAATTEMPTSTSKADIISTLTPLADNATMIYVPAGRFAMGSDTDDSDEKPIHSVNLSAYYIDKYETTNAAYKRCVDAGACTPPKRSASRTRSAYYGNPEFDEYPVIAVDWNMANAYCEWRNARLPTEAEWEKAARGTDGRDYPWGKNVDCKKANILSGVLGLGSGPCVGDTTKVGSYESGKSPYGVYDMAGNVWEWVNDWYDGAYYQSSPSSNPLGPDTGTSRALRGGSWNSGSASITYARSADRFGSAPDSVSDDIGFRCARDANP